MILKHVGYVGRLTSALSLLTMLDITVHTTSNKIILRYDKKDYEFDTEYALLVWLWKKLACLATVEYDWLLAHSDKNGTDS